ncbi:jg24657, partial [Pararge aegeria aegeria]
KLLSRSLKIAHAVLNRTFTSKSSSGGPLTGDNSIKPGDRVALVYPNNDPINFMCAFYGCLQAGIVPVPIEVPLTRRDAGLQQVGFLLGSCGIQYALTSDACLKGLPKTSSGDVVSFRGWPSLQWVSTEKLPRPPRDWIPPPRPLEDCPAHIEHTSAADGSAMGVIVTRYCLHSGPLERGNNAFCAFNVGALQQRDSLLPSNGHVWRL